MLRLPAVVIQVLSGVLLAALGFRAPLAAEWIGTIGLVLLLFWIGVETDLQGLMRSGIEASRVAVLGVIFSLAAGIAGGLAMGWNWQASLFAGGVLCATSVAISARIIQSHGWHERPEGKVVLGAAVADDIIGLLILGLVTAGAGVANLSATIPLLRFLSASAFIGVFGVLALVASRALSQKTLGKGLAISAALGLLCIGVLGAKAAGLEPFIGGFVAGAAVPSTIRSNLMSLKLLSRVLAPVYFVLVGTLVIPQRIFAPSVALAAVVFLLLGAGAKILSALGASRSRSRLAVGLAMVPRGEVGLVFVGSGLAVSVLSQAQYSTLVAAVLATSILAPILLQIHIRRVDGVLANAHRE
jgi:Kef-type K+ transport system membrane component KefB